MNLDIILRTSAVLFVAGAAVAALRRAAPSTRHLVWHIAIIVVLLAPALIRIAPSVPIVPRVPEVPRVVFQEVSKVPGVPEVATAVVHPEPGTAGTRWNPTLGTLGTLGTFGTASWFALCWLLSGLAVWRGSTPAPESWLNEARRIGDRIGFTGRVLVRQSRKDASPHVAGFFTSVIMVPPSAATWTAEARHAALVHELTHIKRGDRRTQAIAQLACAIYWFNPLVWYAAAGLARERERACDDEVLRFGAKPSAYATLLLDLARKPASAWMPQAALSMARPSAIEGRLLSILANAVRTPHRSTRWLIGAAVMVITTTILGAQAQPVVVHQPPVPAAKPRPIVKPQMVMAIDEQTAQPSMTSALVAALADSDRQVREHAAMGLAATPGPEVIDPLLSALRDPDAQVREKAAIGLAFRRDPKIIDALLVAIEDIDSQVREKAAIALGAGGDARAVGALTKAMQDPDSQVREKAVAGLVLLGIRR